MADKKFIGKVFEKTFPDGGKITSISLNAKDMTLLEQEIQSDDQVIIDIKKSQKTGNFYAEISSFRPSTPQPVQQKKSGFGNPTQEELDSLPF